MKIAYTGLNLSEGKIKYEDPAVLALTEKFSPKKVTPYYFDFLPDSYEEADIITISRERILDLIILDIEKLENRRERTTDPEEQTALDRSLKELEKETPLCDTEPTEAGREYLTQLAPLSLKPTLVIDEETIEINDLIPRALQKAGFMFFYTAGKDDVRAWLVPRGVSALTCAGKIHSDLERGFIKAELVTVDDLLQCHSMADARRQGLTRLVDRDFIIPSDTVLEIRFNV